MGRRPFTYEERLAAFWAKTQLLDNGCRGWTASRGASGYGQFQAGPGIGTVPAHRWIYEQLVGPIPPGMQLDHLCHNPLECPGGITCPHRACMEISHLEVVTNHENQLRGGRNQNGTKELCARGHLFDLVYVDHRTGHLWRACSECKRQWKQEWRGKNREHYLAQARVHDAKRRAKKRAKRS